MIEQIMAVVGLAGALVITGTYVALESDRISSKSVMYYVLNATGACLILVSIASQYDAGDTGGILVEVMWLAVSLMGLFKALKRRKTGGGLPA